MLIELLTDVRCAVHFEHDTAAQLSLHFPIEQVGAINGPTTAGEAFFEKRMTTI